jgi:hypothetical protein
MLTLKTSMTENQGEHDWDPGEIAVDQGEHDHHQAEIPVTQRQNPHRAARHRPHRGKSDPHSVRCRTDTQVLDGFCLNVLDQCEGFTDPDASELSFFNAINGLCPPTTSRIPTSAI